MYCNGRCRLLFSILSNGVYSFKIIKPRMSCFAVYNLKYIIEIA
jgi:hypothetical protein